MLFHGESAAALLRASTEALLDPQVLLEAVRDSSGRVVDFRYREVNQATCDYFGLARDDVMPCRWSPRVVFCIVISICRSLRRGNTECSPFGSRMDSIPWSATVSFSLT